MEKNKILMIVIIVLLVVLLGAIIFLGITIGNIVKTNESESNRGTVTRDVPVSLDELAIVPLDSAINTNLKTGTDGVSHMASVSLSVGAIKTNKKESPKIIESLTLNADVVKDICLSAIRAKTFEELRRQDGQDVLRNEILIRLREEFQTNLIYTVYITDMYLD